jgi:hypothetical protein
VAYVYYEEEPGRQAAANLMTKDEARRIAANIVKLPGLPRRSQVRGMRAGRRIANIAKLPGLLGKDAPR